MATYSFQDVAAAIIGPGGAFSLGSGAGAAEEGITVEMTEDKNSMVIGADGQAMHSLHAGKSGTVTIRLLKTSPVNAQLSAMYAVQTASSTLHGQNTISIRDLSRGDTVTCQQAAFKRMTPINYGKDGGTNEWIFDCGQIDTFLGSGT